MKTIKRVVVITLLIVVVFLVGCLFFTGNRLKGYPSEISVYSGKIFEGNNYEMVAFKTNGVWYATDENEVVLFQITNYSDGIITIESNNVVHRIVAIDENTLYDETTKSFLTRRTDNAEIT